MIEEFQVLFLFASHLAGKYTLEAPQVMLFILFSFLLDFLNLVFSLLLAQFHCFSGKDSALVSFPVFLDSLIPGFGGNVHQGESIPD